jgi:hypothetical protein
MPSPSLLISAANSSDMRPSAPLYPLTTTDVNELQRWLMSDNNKLVRDDLGIRMLQEDLLIIQESLQLLCQSPLAILVVSLERFELRLDTLLKDFEAI